MHPRTEPATKLQVFIPTALKRDVDAAAEEAGQLLSVFVQRALAAAVISFKAKEPAQ